MDVGAAAVLLAGRVEFDPALRRPHDAHEPPLRLGAPAGDAGALRDVPRPRASLRLRHLTRSESSILADRLDRSSSSRPRRRMPRRRRPSSSSPASAPPLLRRRGAGRRPAALRRRAALQVLERRRAPAPRRSGSRAAPGRRRRGSRRRARRRSPPPASASGFRAAAPALPARAYCSAISSSGVSGARRCRALRASSAIAAAAATRALAAPLRAPAAATCSSVMPFAASSSSYAVWLLMSMRQPVSFAASRAFWPSLPIASESCRSGTTTSAVFSSSCVMRTLTTCAGLSAFATNRDGSGSHCDDVDALAVQLVHDVLDADAAHADARADRVDALLPRVHRDLRAIAGLARDRLDLDDAAGRSPALPARTAGAAGPCASARR